MTVVSGKRRGRGENSIYWDDATNRYLGAVSLGYSPSGTRVRNKVMGRTKTEVRDKLKELHRQVENGCTAAALREVSLTALDDWLENGLAPSTVTLYRNTIARALREELGSCSLGSAFRIAGPECCARSVPSVSTAATRWWPAPLKCWSSSSGDEYLEEQDEVEFLISEEEPPTPAEIGARQRMGLPGHLIS